MNNQLKATILGLAMSMPGVSMAAAVKAVQIYNNLYNQAAGISGVTSTNISVKYFNGATQCDSATITFRNYASESAGTGSNQLCTDISSIQIIAGPSISNSSLQVYSATPVTVSLTASDFEHLIIVQDLGTGVTGTPASDGSIAPLFNGADGSVSSAGVLGTILSESKIRG